jgi:hypothetical protein
VPDANTFEVLTLKTSSNLVGCSIGSSEVFAPSVVLVRAGSPMSARQTK